MAQLSIVTLGEFALLDGGETLRLPASRRTRALLTYLALTGGPHRRDRLCELFWEAPEDPRAALRCSLSKIRPLINDPTRERLLADRERVTLDRSDLRIDLCDIETELEAADISPERLAEIAELLSRPLADGVDLPPDRIVSVARAWSEVEPFSPDAATTLITRLEQFGHAPEAARAAAACALRFRNAGIEWSPQARLPSPHKDVAHAHHAGMRHYRARQIIRFCTAADSARIAYATLGAGSPIVKAANWLRHLELDWDAPIWSPLFRELARYHRFIRYDERGNGLSDREVKNLSFDSFVTDLESVVDASGLEKFALLGILQGAAVSIEYAVRHPERVLRMILFGGYAAGWRMGATEETIREREAVMTLTATGWGQDNSAYRQIFSSTFMPSATAEELSWFNEFQRRTTSPENAVRFLSAFGDIDVRERLARVSVPTLVIHSERDRHIPATIGRSIAVRIPGAEFLGLDSDGHLLLGREPASRAFVDSVREFLARDRAAFSADDSHFRRAD